MQYTLPLSKFTLAKIVDKYENVRASSTLGYLSPGQANIFQNFEPCNMVYYFLSSIVIETKTLLAHLADRLCYSLHQLLEL